VNPNCIPFGDFSPDEGFLVGLVFGLKGFLDYSDQSLTGFPKFSQDPLLTSQVRY